MILAGVNREQSIAEQLRQILIYDKVAQLCYTSFLLIQSGEPRAVERRVPRLSFRPGQRTSRDAQDAKLLFVPPTTCTGDAIATP
jgi:hypothetical protein